MTATDRTLLDRIDALNNYGRKSALQWLAGYAPEAVERALDEIAAQQAAVAP